MERDIIGGKSRSTVTEIGAHLSDKHRGKPRKVPAGPFTPWEVTGLHSTRVMEGVKNNKFAS